MSLVGQTVVIFGGSSGMGKAAAACVLSQGGSAWLVGRSLTKLATVQAELVLANPEREVKISSVDCSSPENVSEFFAEIPAGSIHHIVVTMGESAGVNDIRGEAGFAGLRRQFDLKFFAQLNPICYGADKLADGGSVVLTSGALSRRPGKGSTALATANAALEAIVKVMKIHLQPFYFIFRLERRTG